MLPTDTECLLTAVFEFITVKLKVYFPSKLSSLGVGPGH